MLLISITVVLLSALMVGYAIRTKAKYSLLRSTMLGLLLAVPAVISMVTNITIVILQIISVSLFKAGCILGGTNFEELTADMMGAEIEVLLQQMRGDTSPDNDDDEDKTLQ